MPTIYRDTAGNRLVKRYIKTRGTTQYTAYNREGRLVNKRGTLSMIRKAGMGSGRQVRNISKNSRGRTDVMSFLKRI